MEETRVLNICFGPACAGAWAGCLRRARPQRGPGGTQTPRGAQRRPWAVTHPHVSAGMGIFNTFHPPTARPGEGELGQAGARRGTRAGAVPAGQGAGKAGGLAVDAPHRVSEQTRGESRETRVALKY